MANALAYSNAQQLPSSTTSTTGVMMGLGSTIKITPTNTGRVKIRIYGWGKNNGTTGVAYCGIQFRYGTGTAPSNGGAQTGSQIDSSGDNNNLGSTSAGYTPFTFACVLASLNVNTAYWFDFVVWTGNSSDSAQIGVLCWSIEEF